MPKNPVVTRLEATGQSVFEAINKRKAPTLKSPLRALLNVAYNEKDGYFELLGKMKARTLTATTVKTFAQTLRMMALSKALVETDDISTKREAYYVSKNWGDARFLEQDESDTIMDDLEAMMRVNREQIGFIPDEHGGDVAGDLVVEDLDPTTGKPLKIDCTKFGSGAYSVPSKVEHLKFQTGAKFILCIETKGYFERLVKHGFYKTAHCILISLGGVPTRACRRFVRRLADEKRLPVYVFTDGDFYAYASIYRTLKVGSGNAAHINEFFCVPQARFLGITPADITQFKLPTHPLKDVDIKRGKDALKNDPFIKHHKPWQKAIEAQLKMGVRAEQQALAARGLNYVITDYMPWKLKHQESWLP